MQLQKTSIILVYDILNGKGSKWVDVFMGTILFPFYFLTGPSNEGICGFLYISWHMLCL